MKTKTIMIILLLVISLMITGCLNSSEIRCNYDGICEEWETDDCPDCADVMDRGVQELPIKTSEENAEII